MNDGNGTTWSKERSVALHVAVHEMFAALKEVKRTVGEQRSRPKAILRQLEALETRLEAIYIEACVQQITLGDMTEIARELQHAYDQLLSDTEVAYQDGWNDAVKELRNFDWMTESVSDDSEARLSKLLSRSRGRRRGHVCWHGAAGLGSADVTRLAVAACCGREREANEAYIVRAPIGFKVQNGGVLVANLNSKRQAVAVLHLESLVFFCVEQRPRV